MPVRPAGQRRGPPYGQPKLSRGGGVALLRGARDGEVIDERKRRGARRVHQTGRNRSGYRGYRSNRS